MRVHDYSGPHRTWGHDYTYEPTSEGGLKGHVIGWGSGIVEGDYLILDNPPGTTRYRVDAVRYYADPPDMFGADVSFAPREQGTCMNGRCANG